MKKVIISLAPTGAWGRGYHNPTTPGEIIQEALDCAEEGASVIHLHSRDMKGNLSAETRELEETFSGITNGSDLIIEASTGGVSDFSQEERIRPVYLKGAVLGSLNLGSLNFGDQVYVNRPSHVEYWIQEMNKNGVKPSLEIFDTGNLVYANSLVERGLIHPPYNFSFIFNVQWGMTYSAELLDYLKNQLPLNSHWGVIMVGSKDFHSHLEAVQRGADFIRVGFEDSPFTGGKRALSNRDLLKALVGDLKIAGFTPATPSEAAQILL
jgi:3-keto-5-aminohexanoate cleavage enzyme